MSTLHHEDMLLDIFDQVQEAFPYLDEEKQIEIANQRFEDLLQWTTTKSSNAIMGLMTFTHQLHLNLVSWMIFITIFFILMQINFTDAELETIAAAMDDYIAYDDPDASPEDLIGGLSVESRVTSICQKIDALYDS